LPKVIFEISHASWILFLIFLLFVAETDQFFNYSMYMQLKVHHPIEQNIDGLKLCQNCSTHDHEFRRDKPNAACSKSCQFHIERNFGGGKH